MNVRRLSHNSLCVTAVLFPLTGIFTPLGIAPLAGLAGLACLPWVLQNKAWKELPSPILWLPLAMMAWAAITATWALDLPEALGGTGKQVLSTIGGLVLVAAVLPLDERERQRLGWALLAGTLVATALLSVEYLTDRGLSSFIASLRHRTMIGSKSPLNRGASILILCGFAGLAQFRGDRSRWRLAVAMLPLLAITSSDSMSTRAAFALAMGAGLLAALLPRLGFKVLMAAVVALWIAAPFAAARIPAPQVTFDTWTWLPPSAHHRTTIWGFTGRHIVEKPILGWGMEASRRIPGGDDEIQIWVYDSQGRQTNLGMIQSYLPLHPHNAILQVWLELGLIGAGLAVALQLAVLLGIDRRLDRDDRLGRAIAAGSFMAALTIAAVSYGVWQSWWQASLWLAAALTLSGLKQRAKPLPRDIRGLP